MLRDVREHFASSFLQQTEHAAGQIDSPTALQMVLFKFGAEGRRISNRSCQSRYILLPTFLRNLPLIELPGQIVIALASSLKQFFPEKATFVGQVPLVGKMAQNEWDGGFGICLVERQCGCLVQVE